MSNQDDENWLAPEDEPPPPSPDDLSKKGKKARRKAEQSLCPSKRLDELRNRARSGEPLFPETEIVDGEKKKDAKKNKPPRKVSKKAPPKETKQKKPPQREEKSPQKKKRAAPVCVVREHRQFQKKEKEAEKLVAQSTSITAHPSIHDPRYQQRMRQLTEQLRKEGKIL